MTEYKHTFTFKGVRYAIVGQLGQSFKLLSELDNFTTPKYTAGSYEGLLDQIDKNPMFDGIIRSLVSPVLVETPDEGVGYDRSFGDALEALKAGKRVARKDWNGEKMFLFLLPEADSIPTSHIHDPALRSVIETETGADTFDALGSIRMFTADKKILTGWLASQTDMLSEDWGILDEDNQDSMENTPDDESPLTLDQLESLVGDWGSKKGILKHSNPYKQYKKLMEEAGELGLAIGAEDTKEIVDGIGDNLVVLILLAKLCGLDARFCLNEAYDVIKQRTGEMKNGVFVKDA